MLGNQTDIKTKISVMFPRVASLEVEGTKTDHTGMLVPGHIILPVLMNVSSQCEQKNLNHKAMYFPVLHGQLNPSKLRGHTYHSSYYRAIMSA